MTKKEFEKRVKEEIAYKGAKVVDMNTSFEKDGIFANTYLTTVLAVNNHVPYQFSAWQNDDDTVTVRFRGILGI